MNGIQQKKEILKKATLYRFVFDGRHMHYVVSILFIFFVFYPVVPVHASEDVPSEEGGVLMQDDEQLTVVSTQVDTLSIEQASSTVVIETDPSAIDEVDTSEDSALDTISSSTITVTEIETEEGAATENSSTTIDTSDDSITVDNGLPDEVTEINQTQEIDQYNTGTSTEVNVDENSPDTESTGSVYDAYVIDSGAYSFDASECIVVSDGSYYCSINDPKTQNTNLEDALYAAPDQEGDMEIYFIHNQKEFKITENSQDDIAPTFDPESNSLVWHRLINDRYQIVSYDIETGKEEILTDNSTNDMEPVRSGNIIVWQRWIQNNWEIIMYNNGEEIQLTSNTVPDIGPKINGDYILWHTTNAKNKKEVALYNIATKQFTQVDDSDDGAVENPRFILMYDKITSNGDTITKGIDVLTGEVIPLAAAGSTLPDNIPESEPTGETRALIHQKINGTKDEHVDFDDDIQNDMGHGTSTIEVAASSTPTIVQQDIPSSETLVVPVATSSLSVDTSQQSASSTDHIDDLVIPPLATTTDTHAE